MSSALLATLLLLSTTPDQIPNPRSHGSWIADTAEVISAADRAVIDSKIDALERELGVEIAVVTVKDVDRTPREFATGLMERWHVGKAAADNGLILLLAVNARKFSSEVGYGLEPILTDGWLAGMQQRAMVPKFKAGDFGGGLRDGVDEIGGRLRQYPEDAREGARNLGKAGSKATLARRPRPTSGQDSLAAGLGFTMIAVAVILGWIMIARWRRRKVCKSCHLQMRLLSEAEEDKYLSQGQQAEEQVGSVNWNVYLCPRCQKSEIIPRRKLFTTYSACGSCGFRTVRSRSLTISHATTYSEGQIQVTETCHHCHHQRTYYRSIPIVVVSSSSSSSWGSSSSSSDFGSSSSSSDFGGGSSGGGGADSSF